MGSPFPRHGTLSRRGFEPRSCAPKAQAVPAGHRHTLTAGYPAVGCLSVRLVPTAQPRPSGRDCASHRRGVLRVLPGIPHRLMSVADPAGPNTVETIQMTASTGCLPRWVSPRGLSTRPRQRRDLNPDHGRDRTVCSPDYTTSACSRPGRNRTGDLRIQSPASLANGDSGA